MSDRDVVHAKNPAAHPNIVDSWFEHLDHPLKDAFTEVRTIILAVDPRIKESIKWGTPTFSFNGDIVSIQSNAKKFVSLMFHRGAEIPGKHEALLGTARLVRTMKFIDSSEVKRRRKELESVIKAWCKWKSTDELSAIESIRVVVYHAAQHGVHADPAKSAPQKRRGKRDRRLDSHRQNGFFRCFTLPPFREQVSSLQPPVSRQGAPGLPLQGATRSPDGDDVLYRMISRPLGAS